MFSGSHSFCPCFPNLYFYSSLSLTLHIRQVGTKCLDLAGQEGMLLLALCRVGMLSVTLDMVRLASRLLRFVVTVTYTSFYIYICAEHRSEMMLFISLGQVKSLNFARREKALKSIGTTPKIKIFLVGMFLTEIQFYFDPVFPRQVCTDRRQLTWNLLRDL